MTLCELHGHCSIVCLPFRLPEDDDVVRSINVTLRVIFSRVGSLYSFGDDQRKKVHTFSREHTFLTS